MGQCLQFQANPGEAQGTSALPSALDAGRLAIARAVLRDAPILILDEATSSVEAEAEGLIKQALERRQWVMGENGRARRLAGGREWQHG